MTHAIRILDGTIPEYNDKAPRFRNIDMTVEESLILLPLNSGVCHGVSHWKLTSSNVEINTYLLEHRRKEKEKQKNQNAKAKYPAHTHTCMCNDKPYRPIWIN